MQIILTQEEYESLKSQAEAYAGACSLCNKLHREIKELEDKYTKLLVFGVSSSNERLKGKL